MMLLVLLLVLRPVVAHAQTSAPKPRFVIEICAAELTPTVKLGFPVVVTVRFANNSDKNVDWSGIASELTRVDPNWQFDVRDGVGEPVPLRHNKHEELSDGSLMIRGVGPGKCLVDNVDLARLYDFCPGAPFFPRALSANSNSSRKHNPPSTALKQAIARSENGVRTYWNLPA
jgi:hypothetical protein